MYATTLQWDRRVNSVHTPSSRAQQAAGAPQHRGSTDQRRGAPPPPLQMARALSKRRAARRFVERALYWYGVTLLGSRVVPFRPAGVALRKGSSARAPDAAPPLAPAAAAAATGADPLRGSTARASLLISLVTSSLSARHSQHSPVHTANASEHLRHITEVGHAPLGLLITWEKNEAWAGGGGAVRFLTVCGRAFAKLLVRDHFCQPLLRRKGPFELRYLGCSYNDQRHTSRRDAMEGIVKLEDGERKREQITQG